MAIFKTNDGAGIHYEVTGEGKPLVLMHGWDQSGKAFCENVPVLSKKYKVINIDLRGHGESENVTYGYRISRLSMDVKQLLDYLDVQDATLLGWSMGCSVLWGYWDLYRNERISKLIMVDEPPLCLVNESNPDGFADNDACVDLKRRILTETEAAAKDFTSMMIITPEGRAKYFDQTVEENLKLPAEQCALLFLNHVYTDWRDVIKTVTVPTLVVGAKNSHVKVANNVWTHEHIPGSQLKIFETAHMMFMEEPEAFNAAVMEFIG
ncbi:MAG: alpha/beta hydrolase [Oscillospiraceae bacterium]|nr:alpha/beta hydrolase [Oscillospiraceae bacterium]